VASRPVPLVRAALTRQLAAFGLHQHRAIPIDTEPTPVPGCRPRHRFEYLENRGKIAFQSHQFAGSSGRVSSTFLVKNLGRRA
jgi:hypothetical protein